jgi:hypothetical protein
MDFKCVSTDERKTVNYGIDVYKHIFLEYEHCSEEVISIKSNPK